MALSIRKKRLTLAACFLLLCAADRRRRRTRFYLTRAVLPPDPRQHTAWQYLYHSRDNHSFILTMGLSVSVFETILNAGFATIWNSKPIPRNDIKQAPAMLRTSKPQRRSLDAAGALGLVLHHLNSAMTDHGLQQIFALTPAVCSRYRNWGLYILQFILRHIPAAAIRWPSTSQECSKYAELISTHHHRLDKAFGFVDGCHLPVLAASNLDTLDAYYNRWCAAHYTSNVFVFAPDGTIIHATINAPGSWHDATVSHGLFHKLSTRTPDDYWLIGDTAFPALDNRIKTPLKTIFNEYPSDPTEYQQFIQFHGQLGSARQEAEWGIRGIQGSFGRLKMPMSVDDSAYRFRLLEVCCRLHNLRVSLEGIDQIKTVYEEIWKSGGSYTDFGDKSFRDIQKNDRVWRFYYFVL
jgi:hypothetical protein